VNKHSFKEVFKLQAQTKLGFGQVFHLKFRLEVSHRFLNVPGRTDGDDAKSITGFLYEDTRTVIIVDVTSLHDKATQPVEPHPFGLF
jgi:hypothetical protein